MRTATTFNGSIISVVNGTQDVNSPSIVVTPGALAFASVLGDPVEVWATPSAGLACAGVYSLTLTGTNSASIGSYAGNLALTPGVALAVPEPETYAMLLAGSGSSAWWRAPPPRLIGADFDMKRAPARFFRRCDSVAGRTPRPPRRAGQLIGNVVRVDAMLWKRNAFPAKNWPR